MPQAMTRTDIGGPLLALARGAIARELGAANATERIPPDLAQVGATFVTLRSDGDLRGCIGTVDAWRPLADDVRANAVAAAFRDPRFPPLRRDELVQVTIEVSVLNPSEPVPSGREASLAATNVTDAFYYESQAMRAGAPYFSGTGRPGAPREYFMTIKRNFD